MDGLLGRMFRGRSADSRKPSVLPGTIVYAVGDIHGRFDLLQNLRDRIFADRRSSSERDAVIVFLGDYVDRGLDSKRVINFLAGDGFDGFRTVFLRGNHEQAMLDFLEGKDIVTDWFAYGGLETLYSYGVQMKGLPSSAAAIAELRDALKEAVPEWHVEFMRACPLMHVEGDYLFVHAGVRPGVPLACQVSSDLLWIRDDFLDSRKGFEGKVVVHGHTICDKPQNRPYRINVDTGAFVSGCLTAVVLHEQSRRFLSTAA